MMRGCGSSDGVPSIASAVLVAVRTPPLGCAHMLGLVEGEPSNAAKAVKYLEKAGEDSRALNALGVIYYIAPEVFETDPVRQAGFYGVKRDLKKAENLFMNPTRAAKSKSESSMKNMNTHLSETLDPK